MLHITRYILHVNWSHKYLLWHITNFMKFLRWFWKVNNHLRNHLAIFSVFQYMNIIHFKQNIWGYWEELEKTSHTQPHKFYFHIIVSIHKNLIFLLRLVEKIMHVKHYMLIILYWNVSSCMFHITFNMKCVNLLDFTCKMNEGNVEYLGPKIF